MTLGKLSELRKQRDQRPSNKTHPPPSIAPQNDRAGTALHDSGKTAVSPAAVGCHGAGRSAPARGCPRCFSCGAVPCCPHGVIRFQHPRKISSILIRDTVAPIAIRTASGSYSLTDVKSPHTGAVMSIIPLDLQRRCERRWAARFSRPIPSAAPRNQRPVRESLQVAAPAKSNEQPAGLKRQA